MSILQFIKDPKLAGSVYAASVWAEVLRQEEMWVPRDGWSTLCRLWAETATITLKPDPWAGVQGGEQVKIRKYLQIQDAIAALPEEVKIPVTSMTLYHKRCAIEMLVRNKSIFLWGEPERLGRVYSGPGVDDGVMWCYSSELDAVIEAARTPESREKWILATPLGRALHAAIEKEMALAE